MRAIGYQSSRPVSDEASLVDIDIPTPEPGKRDLLVSIQAVSVNPVDTKIRMRVQPEPGAWKILGYDAAGIVERVGPEVTRFRPGDAVFYSGAIGRPGTNAQFHLVDERIVGAKPATLSMAAAAALPLTAITAWETLFDRLDIRRPVPSAAPAILIIGGAGGVGSIAIQLVRQLTDLTVIATASRPETREWCTSLGAHIVLDHSKPLAAQVASLATGQPGFVFSTTNTDQHLAEVAQLIAPQGRFAVIDDPVSLDVRLFKQKCVSTHWEFMFARSTFETADMIEQGRLLDEVSRLVDAGTLKTTFTDSLGPICAANLRRAHSLIETGTVKGKLVLDGWG